MCLRLPLPLSLAAPEAPAEQQEQEDPGRCWHCGGRERIHASGARRAAAAPCPGPRW